MIGSCNVTITTNVTLSAVEPVVQNNPAVAHLLCRLATAGSSTQLVASVSSSRHPVTQLSYSKQSAVATSQHCDFLELLSQVDVNSYYKFNGRSRGCDRQTAAAEKIDLKFSHRTDPRADDLTACQ